VGVVIRVVSAASTYTLAYYPDSNQLRSMTNEQGERTRRGASTTNGDTNHLIVLATTSGARTA
jgi:hypothetical protein